MRRSLAWLFVLPLILSSSQLAHVLAYRWVYPSSHVRLQALLSTGHGYMDQLPLVFGVAAAVAFVSLLVAVVDVARGLSHRALPAWAFALLPLLTFAVQEILERSLYTGSFLWQAVEQPTFVPGLALQLPFAAVAYLLARLLLRTVHVIGRIIGSRRAMRAPRRATSVRLPRVVSLPRLAPLACAAAGRAPPPLALSLP